MEVLSLLAVEHFDKKITDCVVLTLNDSPDYFETLSYLLGSIPIKCVARKRNEEYPIPQHMTHRPYDIYQKVSDIYRNGYEYTNLFIIDRVILTETNMSSIITLLTERITDLSSVIIRGEKDRGIPYVRFINLLRHSGFHVGKQSNKEWMQKMFPSEYDNYWYIWASKAM